MNYQTTVLMFMVILNIGLAFLVLLNNCKNRVNLIFALFISSVVLWMGSNYFANFYGPYALLWDKLTFLGAVLIAFFLVYFSVYFPKFEKKLNFKTHLLILLPTAIISALILFTNRIIAGVTIIETGTGVQQGSWYSIWPIYFLAYIFYALYNLAKKYRGSKGKEQIQIKFVLIGIILSLLLATTTNLIFPLLFKNDTLSNFGPYATLIFISFTSYAIVKHELLNIRVIATETLTALIVLVLLVQTLLSETWTEGLIRGAFLILMAYFGYLLIKSVIDEIERRKEIERLSKQLEQANIHLQDLDKLKSEFVSIASHDLLTPVAAIEGYLSMILDEKLVPVENPKLKEYLDRVYGSSKRLARLIADLLNISRIEEGRLIVEKKEEDIIPLIQNTIDELIIQAQKHNLSLKFQKPAEIPPVYIDPNKIKEVLINLIGNAIKFTQKGGVEVSVDVWPTQQIEEKSEIMHQESQKEAEKRGEMLPQITSIKTTGLVGDRQVVIQVKDTGCGISKTDLPDLFQKFSRGKGWVEKQVQGSGLGLYISKSLVELNNGRIWAESEIDKGSIFSISLPLAEYKEALKKSEIGEKPKGEMKPLAKGPAREF